MHICACGNAFDRKQRLIDHIPRSPGCGLSLDNIQMLQSGGHTLAIMDIHSKYFALTSRSIDDHKYREVRRLLKEIHAQETARVLAVQEAEEAERAQRYEIAKSIIGTQQETIDALQKRAAEDAAKILELQETMQKSLKYKRKFEAQLETENKIADLLDRVHRSGKTYKYTLSATDLAPFSMPNSNGVLDDDFERIFNVPNTTPDNIIDQYTYMLFKNANERQLVYIQNRREQTVWIMKGVDPLQVDKVFLRGVVEYVLKEIREHITKYKGRIALRWSVLFPDSLLTDPIVIRNTSDRQNLSRDQQTMRLLNILYEHTHFMYIKDHVRAGTKSEEKEITKTVKSSHTCVVSLIYTLYRLNKAHTKQKQLSDTAIFKRFC